MENLGCEGGGRSEGRGEGGGKRRDGDGKDRWGGVVGANEGDGERR